MRRFVILALFLVLAVCVVPASADTIEIPLWGTLSGFNLGEPYRGQTFIAESGLAEQLTVYMAGSDDEDIGTDFRILLTEVDDTGGFRLTHVLFESSVQNVPFDRTTKIYTYTVDLGGIPLIGGKTYAWVFDAYGLAGGTSRTGICRFDCYDDGMAFGHIGPFTSGNREDHFEGPWLMRHLNDLAFTLEFTPEQSQDNAIPGLPLLLLDNDAL